MPEFSRLKVCFLAGTLEHGGCERQLFHMLQALCQGGASPRLLCLDRGEFWEQAIRSLGVPVTWVGQRQSRLARLLRVLKVLRLDLPDLFQSQHFFANAYAGLADRLLGVRSIGAMRNEGAAEMSKNGKVGGWLNLHLPRFIAANNRNAMQQAVARGVAASRLHFLPNVVDTGRFRPTRAQARRPVTLLTVGRIVEEKRFDLFISALARLRSELKLRVEGWIVGPPQDARLAQELEAQGARLGLVQGALRFLGGVSDMAPLYPLADICVLASDFEGTPNVLLEAMACGLPVVATKVGGVPQIVQHGETGFLCGRNDLDGLVAALARLGSDEALRTELGNHAREYVVQNHSLERLPTYLAELYARTLPSSRSWDLGVVRETPA